MITRVRVVRFKRFLDQTFDLPGSSILLAGPNNSGKTTLLQAISAWNQALVRWLAERGEEGGKKRIGLVLDEFTALPLREMNLLWLNRHTARQTPGKKQPKPAPIYIEVCVRVGQRIRDESLTIEFMYANEKLVYVRPVNSPDEPDQIERIPDFAKSLHVVHVPPFSGIGTQEPRHAPGIQNKFIGEGKPGEIVRNLLLDICPPGKLRAEGQRDTWKELSADIARLFQCELLPPQFSDAQPYIICEYRPPTQAGDRSPRGPKLDIANAGSGFHQVLLLLSFFYARPSSVMLLDEPDAHLHFILQREIFDHLRGVAQRRNCKLIIATHAEVLLAGTEPDQIISFVGTTPRRLVDPSEKRRLQDALQRLSALDLVQADHVRAVLYVEDESDFKILREWAEIAQHPATRFLRFPYVVPLQGKGNLDDAKRHFQCLTLARPQLRGLVVLDRDLATSESPGNMPAGLRLVRWKRYEIENYLLMPTVLKRLAQGAEGLFTLHAADQDARSIEDAFGRNFPASVDYLSDLPALRDLKASDFLVELLEKTSSPMPKRDLYMLAKLMKRDEIHPDVFSVLDAVASIVPPEVPVEQADAAPLDRDGVAGEPDDPPAPVA